MKKPVRTILQTPKTTKHSLKTKSLLSFKKQIETTPNITQGEIFGYKKAKGKFINKTVRATELRVHYDHKHKFFSGKHTEIHTHICNPKVNFESVPSPHDFYGWVDDFLTTSGKKNRAVVSSIHFKSGKELGRVHILLKQNSLNNQLKKHIYDAYVDSIKNNNRTPLPFEKFNADLFYLQESGKARTHLNKIIERDFDFEKRAKNNNLKEIFKDIENKWGIKIRVFSHPSQKFDYSRGSFS